jgi:hypothetical protein
MNLQSLEIITKSLEVVFTELERAGLRDTGIRHRYAEFLVASALAKRRHNVQVLAEQEDKSADIYLPAISKRIEVKSCKAYNIKGQVD